MTIFDLKELTLKNLGIERIHPLHDLMLDECCENALKISTDEELLIQSVQISFLVANSTLKAVLKAGLESASFITLNYRNEQFTIDNKSPLIKE